MKNLPTKFIVTFTDGVTAPVSIATPSMKQDYDEVNECWGGRMVPSKWNDTTNTLAEAMELAADFLDDMRKDLQANGIEELHSGAECIIFQRVTGTRGRTTQTVHLLS